jgi:hypothetical protein
MRSFRIMQLLHANDTKQTQSLEEKSLIEEMPNNISRALAMYTDTLTGPDGEVYQVSSDALSELSEIMANLANFNFSKGGVCLPPTLNLYNQTNCLDYNNTEPQQWNTILFLDACNYNSNITLNTSVILGVFSAFCSLAPTPPSDDNQDYDFAVLSLYALLGIIALFSGLVAGLYCGNRLFSRPAFDNEDWLDRRYREGVRRSDVIIEDVTAAGGAEEAKQLTSDSHEDVGSAVLHEGGDSRRNSMGYSRLS